MAFDYKNLQHTALNRLTTANNPKKSKIRAGFLIKENNFYKKHIRDKFVLVGGSGLGHDSFRIARYNRKVIGVDILPLLVNLSKKAARKRDVKNIRFETGDFTNLKYKNNFFDVAILNMGTIGNFNNRKKIIKELIRVAKEVYVDFYINSEYALKRRKKMYEEEGWGGIKIKNKKIISLDGLESNPIEDKEFIDISKNLGLDVSFHKFSDIAKMAIFKNKNENGPAGN